MRWSQRPFAAFVENHQDLKLTHWLEAFHARDPSAAPGFSCVISIRSPSHAAEASCSTCQGLTCNVCSKPAGLLFSHGSLLEGLSCVFTGVIRGFQTNQMTKLFRLPLLCFQTFPPVQEDHPLPGCFSTESVSLQEAEAEETVDEPEAEEPEDEEPPAKKAKARADKAKKTKNERILCGKIRIIFCSRGSLGGFFAGR